MFECACHLDADGEVAAGVCHARGGNADLPLVWLPYFAVASADDAIARAQAGGGRVVAGPKGYDAYRYVVIEDPAGIMSQKPLMENYHEY